MTIASTGESSPEAAIPHIGPWREVQEGWRIVLAVVLAIFMFSLPSFTIGVFIGPLADYFHASHTKIVTWSLFWSIGCIPASPLVGRLADRYGARRMLLTGLPIYGLAILYSGLWANTLPMLLAGSIAIGALATTVSAVVCGRLISGYFDRGLGTALGLMSCGIGLSAVFGPSLMQQVIDTYGWRSGFIVQGVLAFVFFPLVWLLTNVKQTKTRNSAMAATGYSLTNAFKAPAFWFLAVATVCFGICVSGTGTNIVVYMTSKGYSRELAAGMVGAYGLCSVVSRIITGMALDRIPVHAARLMTIVMSLMAPSFLLVGFSPVFVGIAAGLAIFGFFVGAEVDCLAYCTLRVFGRPAFGAIYGFIGMGMLYVGIGTGPVLFSATQVALDSYPATFAIWTGLGLVAAALFFVVGYTPYVRMAEGVKPAH